MSPSHRRSEPLRSDERRTNLALREVLDEFLTLTRHLARRAADLEPAELSAMVERLEWLADEVVRLTTDPPGDG